MQTYGQHIEQGLLQSINRAIMSTDGGEALTKQRKREGFTKYLWIWREKYHITEIQQSIHTAIMSTELMEEKHWLSKEKGRGLPNIFEFEEKNIILQKFDIILANIHQI